MQAMQCTQNVGFVVGPPNSCQWYNTYAYCFNIYAFPLDQTWTHEDNKYVLEQATVRKQIRETTASLPRSNSGFQRRGGFKKTAAANFRTFYPITTFSPSNSVPPNYNVRNSRAQHADLSCMYSVLCRPIL